MCLTRVCATFVVLLAAQLSTAADLKPEEIIARHLDSIAAADTRAAAKSRVVQGTLRFKVPVGGGR